MSALTLALLLLWRLCAGIPWGAGYGVVSESGNPRMLALVVGRAILLIWRLRYRAEHGHAAALELQ